MTRTLTAGAPAAAPKPFLPPKYQPDVEALTWGCIHELEALGRERRRLAPKERRIRAQTSDPALYEHPKYGEAMARWLRWASRLDGIDRQAASLRENLARHWNRLQFSRKRQIQETLPWFSQQETGEAFAEETWRFVIQEEGRNPLFDCPFILAGLVVIAGMVL